MLLGRERECEQIEAMLGSVRAGRAASLVLRGEAGVGKTALLDHAAERGLALGMDCVRVQALESEASVAFAGLLLACRPILGHVDALPRRQAEALLSALEIGRAHV